MSGKLVRLAVVTSAVLALGACGTGDEADTGRPDDGIVLAGITHRVVCRCTCKSDNTPAANIETHALPSGSDCETLNGVQCEAIGPPSALGMLEECFRKSIPVDD